LPVFKGVDLSKRRIPIMIKRAVAEGPKIWLCGAIHGDEVTGIEVIHRVFDYLDEVGLKKGIVYSFPVMNSQGFEMISRHLPSSGEDLNRQFPGSPNGSPAERVTWRILDHISKTKPDLVIDLHTDTMQSISYILVDRFTDEAKQAVVGEAVKFAETFGVTWVYEYPDYYPEAFYCTFTTALMNLNIPAFTVEIGGPNIINEAFVVEGVEGIKNVLQNMGMIEPKDRAPWKSPTKRKDIPSPLKLIQSPKPETSGVIEDLVKPGEWVKKGRIVARIKNVFGKLESSVRIDSDALILSSIDQSIAFPGIDIFMVAGEDKTSQSPLVINNKFAAK
jgi:predicted deacylase